MTRHSRITGMAGMCILVTITAAMPPTRQITEPTDRSMLPPVRIHSSMPQAMTST